MDGNRLLCESHGKASICSGQPRNNMRDRNTINAGARISIVDDDESMREAIKTLIRSIGLSVEEFSSAEDFLYSGRSQVVDCLILDIRMVGLGGL